MGLEAFKQLCLEHNEAFLCARDECYDAVICLRSATHGAPEFYSSTTNQTRYENLDEARALDERTEQAWLDTPRLLMIENRPGASFAEKMERTVAALARALGEPEPLESERTFKITNYQSDQLLPQTAAITIVQTYLVSEPHVFERVRASGQGGSGSIPIQQNSFVGLGYGSRYPVPSAGAEYDNFLVHRNQKHLVVYKTRHYFVSDNQYCELDVFAGHLTGLVLLGIKVPDELSEVVLLPTLEVDQAVTGDPGYFNYFLAVA